MDLHSEMIFQEYLNNKPIFTKLRSVVDEELRRIVKDLNLFVNGIESRIKTEKSLSGKLEIKGFKYKSLSDITDIVGARIITFYPTDVDRVAAEIEKRFIIDFDNSIDKRKIYKVDQFGYMSLHYICTIPKSLYCEEDAPLLNEFKFEIQIRTTLQHVWASIYHDTGYKNDVEVPTEYLRSLNRLAGLLELADNEFENIRTSLDEYRRQIKSVVASGDFGAVDLNGDTFKEYLKIEPFEKLNKRIAKTNNMEIENVSLFCFIGVFKTMGFKTLKDVQEMIKNDSEEAFQIAIRQFSGTDLDIMSSLTGPMSLCFAHSIKNGGGSSSIIDILTAIYGIRPANIRYAKRIMDIATNMGLIK